MVPVTPVTINVPTNVLGKIVNVPVKVVTGTVTEPLNVLRTTVNAPINILGNTVNVTVNVPTTTVTVTSSVLSGPVTISVPVGVDAPININLPVGGGLVGTINAVDAIVAVRRNDALLNLDLGLDRQIDILTGGNGHWGDSGDLWSEPSALGGPRPSGAMLDGWGSGTTSRLASFSESFATSMQQARQANATTSLGEPYGLGATSRAAAPPPRPAFDVWMEGAVAHFSDGSDQSERHGHLGVVYVGADYRLSRNVLVGALVQYNQTSHDFDALQAGGSDSGWMVGPYATVRLSNNLFFQARAAWGKTDVKVDLDSTHQDSFDAERWLVRGTLLGQWRWGPWQFRPRASVGYIEEHQDGYELARRHDPEPDRRAGPGQGRTRDRLPLSAGQRLHRRAQPAGGGHPPAAGEFGPSAEEDVEEVGPGRRRRADAGPPPLASRAPLRRAGFIS